jgi:SAM-dependent methyltransferase
MTELRLLERESARPRALAPAAAGCRWAYPVIVLILPVVTAYDADAFDVFEASGWDAVASEYDEHWSSITSRAIDPLLDAAGVERGARAVDVGAGSGDAAGRAAERGAIATGVDVAAAMVEIAARRHPAAQFVQASATRLPFADGSFDAAVGNIVIQHIGEPERAALELARVLVSGGRVALSTWDAPERSPFFATILGAVADADVPPPTSIPAGPSFFQFADGVVFAALLQDAGFADVHIDAISFEVPLRSAEDLIAGLVEGTVRTGALLRAANEAQGALIRESLEVRLEPWRRGASYAVPASVKIASGRKPS